MSAVVIVGAGHAGLGAALELRTQGFSGSITLVDKSTFWPYERPPISKSWVAGTAGPEELAVRSEQSYAEADITLLRGTCATSVDRDHRVVVTDGGELRYDSLVLALGASPRPLVVPGHDLGRIHSLHTLEQATALREELRETERLVVVGGGFIGLELASTFAGSGKVAVVEIADRLMARATSEITSAHMRRQHESLGVEIHLGTGVEGFSGSGGCLDQVHLSNGESLEADVAVLGVGVNPNGAWVEEIGLAFDDGIVVDECLRTADPRIYAIGDCARFPDDEGGTMRLESIGSAADHARRVAGEITGSPCAGVNVPWFWTKQAGVRLQMVGYLSKVKEWVVSGAADSGAFSVIGLSDDRIVYGESINRAADHVLLKRLMTDGPITVTDQVRQRLGEGLKVALQSGAA